MFSATDRISSKRLALAFFRREADAEADGVRRASQSRLDAINQHRASRQAILPEDRMREFGPPGATNPPNPTTSPARIEKLMSRTCALETPRASSTTRPTGLSRSPNRVATVRPTIN